MRAEAVAKSLGRAQRAGRGWLTFCPAHDNYETPALSLADCEDGRLLVHCFAGCHYGAVLDALAERHLLQKHLRNGPSVAANQITNRPRQNDGNRIQAARRIWNGTVPADGTLVEAYLHRRGICGPIPQTLRFSPKLGHPSGGRFPAMVAAVAIEGKGQVQGVHRLWLAPCGSKAAVTPVKALVGVCRGGAVRLSRRQGNRIIVTEGIEDGLALLGVLSGTVWAAPGASFMANLSLPGWATEVWIAPDHDAAGLTAAERLAWRSKLDGRSIRIVPPPTPGTDWNAALTAQASAV